MWRRLIIGMLVLASVALAIAQAAWDARTGVPEATIISESFVATSPLSVGAVARAFIEFVLPTLEWAALGWVVARRRPNNALGWLFLVSALLSSSASFVATLFLPTVVLALYPDGRLPAPWWRWPFGVAVVGVVLQLGYGNSANAPDFVDDVIGGFLIAPAVMTMLIGTAIRWALAGYPERQQLTWFAGSALLSYSVMLGTPWLPFWYSSPYADLVQDLLSPTLVIPIGVAVGLLRYRLLGIRVVVPRRVLYAGLTMLVFTTYALVVASLASSLGVAENLGILVAAVVAACMAPVRDRLQLAADRLVYGARRDPLKALADLSDSIATNGRLVVTRETAGAVAAAVHADGAMIVTPSGDVLASAGDTATRYHAIPLRIGGVEAGELRVAGPAGGECYTEPEIRLLTALANQLAVIVSAINLADAVEAERNRVVAATRDERERLRRDLHDGLGPSLAGMSLGLEALVNRLGEADPTAGALTQRLRTETGNAVRDIRRIIDGLRPTVLDTETLTRAVERHAGTLDAVLPVDVTAGTLPALAPDVEAAAYRIITEALTNAARHAHAHHAHVTISADDELRIAVSDDGHGIQPHGLTRGVGLSSMRRRAEELGGGLDIHSTDSGTTVTATLPLHF